LLSTKARLLLVKIATTCFASGVNAKSLSWMLPKCSVRWILPLGSCFRQRRFAGQFILEADLTLDEEAH
jgi:hypothetical protein